jgi:ABC-type lipoprotein release transport system permease subunit
MESNTSIQESLDTLINIAFSLFDVMGVLSVMVASLGVVNTFPLGGVITSLVVALVISQMAVIQPARKASRTNILEAIQYE